MRISDWSSDVCSSDLVDVRRSDRADCGVDAYRLGVQIALLVKEDAHAGVHDVRNVGVPCPAGDYVARTRCAQHYLDVDARQGSRFEGLGEDRKTSCRERVC